MFFIHHLSAISINSISINDVGELGPILGMIGLILDFIGAGIIAAVNFPVVRNFLSSDLIKARDGFQENRRLSKENPGFKQALKIIETNVDLDEVRRCGRQNEAKLPDDLFSQARSIRLKSPGIGIQSGDYVALRYDDDGYIEEYDIGSPITISRWFNEAVERNDYEIIVKMGFPLLALGFYYKS